ncbi:unnamed protein product [Echinostoma caproni]|uniref:Protein arginine methyltransferase NDUFAF7 n=1 Tax=Echinostoma caproni TaxID=27848 RepID=A0A183BEE5_9TREM|nr:unnamed protein product [Echinostoma caproni]
MESASVSGNAHKLFRLIRDTGNRSHASVEPYAKLMSNVSTIYNVGWGTGRSTIQLAIDIITISRFSAPWSVDISSTTEQEVFQELRLLQRHKSLGPDELPSVVFKGGGASFVRELTFLFQTTWNTESIPSD